MANVMLGYQNQVPGAVLTASTAANGLGPSQLQNDQGSPSTAWQTVGMSGTLQIDSGSDATTWRAFLLARTNLTAAATVRWRVGPVEALVEAPPAFVVNLAGATAASLSAGAISYGRTSAATLADPSTGFLTAFAAGSPRANAQGLLMEGAATNLFGNNDSGTTGQLTGSGNAVASQGGSNCPGAVTSQCTFNGSDTNLYYIGIGGLTAGQTYTASWWVYIPGSATLSSLTLAWEGNASNGFSVNANLAVRDKFQLVWCRAQINAASSSAVMRIGGAPSGTQIYVCSKQVESGPAPTSFIPTSGGAAASRSADTFSITAGVAAACASGSYSLSVLASWPLTPAPGVSCDIYLNHSGTLAAMARIGSAAQGLAFGPSGSQVMALANAYPANAFSTRSAVAISPGALGFASFGQPAQQLSGYAAGLLPDTLSAGCFPNVSVFVSTIILYPARLSQSQLAALCNNGSTLTNAYAFDSGTAPAGVVPGFGQTLAISPSDVSGRMAQVDIADPSNPDGFLNVPLAYAGPVFQPMRNYDYNSGHGRTQQATQKVSRSGGVTWRTDWLKRCFDLSLSGIRSGEIATVLALDAAGRSGANVLLVPDPASASRNKEAIFGTFEPSSLLTYPSQAAEARGYRATATERL